METTQTDEARTATPTSVELAASIRDTAPGLSDRQPQTHDLSAVDFAYAIRSAGPGRNTES